MLIENRLSWKTSRMTSCYFGWAIIAGDFDYTVSKIIITWENSLLLLYEKIQYKPLINRRYEDESTLQLYEKPSENLLMISILLKNFLEHSEKGKLLTTSEILLRKAASKAFLKSKK